VNIKYNSLTKSLGRKIGAFVRSVICHGEDHGVAYRTLYGLRQKLDWKRSVRFLASTMKSDRNDWRFND